MTGHKVSIKIYERLGVTLMLATAGEALGYKSQQTIFLVL